MVIEVVSDWRPLVVHFAIVLPLMAMAFFAAGTVPARRATAPGMALVVRRRLGSGVLAAAVAPATGWYAYDTVAHDGPSRANMTAHMRRAIGTIALVPGAAAA